MRFIIYRLMITSTILTLLTTNAIAAPVKQLRDNQTLTVSTILPGSQLPFRVDIEQVNFELPVGFQSGVVGVYKNNWVFIAGRINGMHGFGPPPNFPADKQNTDIYVVNAETGVTISRSLFDPSSGLTQQQIDTLSVTSPEGFQEGTTLYLVGGYGLDAATLTMTTKPVLTALNLPGIINWVQTGSSINNIANNIKQIYNPIFQITGGRLYNLNGVMQLVFGQDFEGEYTPGSDGIYSEQVRRFTLTTVNGQFAVNVLPSMPSIPQPNFRRRDLNVVPALFTKNSLLTNGLIAYSGVFTPTAGIWTVPVTINGVDDPQMADPVLSTTFKQGMSNYACATASLYSRKDANMYHIFFGGLSFGFFVGGTFTTDTEVPFINQITTVKMDQAGNFTQYIMDSEYPVIVSTGTNPGNPLLFGGGAYFIPTNILKYPNAVINLDRIRKPTVIGYIVGGIASTVPNTSTMADAIASPYVFKVVLTPTG